MMRMWVGGVCCLASVAVADEPDARTLVARANIAYAQEDYATALEGYRQAEVTLPESPELAYDRGLAHYQLGEFAEARDYFNRALRTRDLELEAKSKFNLGNVAYASAIEKLSDLQEAIDLLKTAIGQYRDTLELTADDEDAKTNIQTAHLLIKDLLDKLKKRQEEQEKEQGDQDQEQQEQDQEGEQQDGDQDQEGEKQDGENEQEGDGEQERDGEQQEPQDEEQQDKEAQGQQEQEAREMTREEAERLLQSVRDRERQRREDRARRARARWVPVLKDW